MSARSWRLPTRNQALLLLMVLLATVAGAVAIGAYAAAPADQVPASSSTPESGLPTIAVGELPGQARETLALIDRGGPYPYDQDNTIFGNNERLLPQRQRGYYREYTVVTPGASSRGTRRLVVGADGDVYYTADHYESFRQVLR